MIDIEDSDYSGFIYGGGGTDGFLNEIFGTKESRQANRELKGEKKAAKVEDKKAKTAIKTNESNAKIEGMKGDLEAQKALLASGGVAPGTSATDDSPNYMLYGGIGLAVIVIGVVLYFTVFKKA